MARHDPTVSMRQMRDHAAEAMAMCRHNDLEDFLDDRMLQLAVTHLCEIVGEAANRVPGAVQQHHPEVPWVQAIRFRNRVAHGYDAINLQMVWGIVDEEFPAVVLALDAILDRTGTRTQD